MIESYDSPELAAKALVGNWQRFESFAYFGDEDPDEWTMVSLENRDSGPLVLSNSHAIRESLEPFPEDVIEGSCSHWAVGWLSHIMVRVYAPRTEGDESPRTVTEAWRTLCALADRMADYPLLDEDDYSQRCHEDLIEYIESCYLGDDLIDNLPEEWTELVAGELYDMGADTVDGDSTYVRESAMREALSTLGYLVIPENEDPDDTDDGPEPVRVSPGQGSLFVGNASW